MCPYNPTPTVSLRTYTINYKFLIKTLKTTNLVYEIINLYIKLYLIDLKLPRRSKVSVYRPQLASSAPSSQSGTLSHTHCSGIHRLALVELHVNSCGEHVGGEHGIPSHLNFPWSHVLQENSQSSITEL